jgi:polar amino acid transport system substrate-binding protein
MKKIISLILVLALATFVFAACGEKENKVTSGEKEDKVITMATSADFPPYEYYENDEIVGIDIDIMAYIAEQLGMELVIVDMDFDAVITAVGKNGIDVAVSGLTVNETRKQSVNFTHTYYNAAQMLIVPDTVTDFDACKTADDVLKVLADLLK